MEQTLFSFNRGKISSLALARIDQKRVNLSAETMANWVPRTLGPMSLRPGLQYLFSSYSDNTAKYVPFVFASDDQAIVEFTNLIMRVIIDDVVLTRPSVSTAVTNGGFDTDLTGWTDSDETGAASAWATGGYMSLVGNGAAEARRDQTLTVAGGDQNVEHALRIVITHGPVYIRVGSTVAGTDDLISETALEKGTHSLSFTPTGGSVYVRFFSSRKYSVQVNSCTIEAAGAVTITSPYAAADLDNIRYDQSGDVIFIACKDTEWQRVERRATRSWSLVRYAPEDGPFRAINVSPITMTPGARTGSTTLTASQSFFKSTNVGSLFRLTITGQTETQAASAENVFTDSIRVTGSASRAFLVQITGTWTGTVTLQRSFETDTGPWEDVPAKSWTANTSETYTDGLTNQIVFYRLGIKTGDYGSGTANLTLQDGQGVGVGVCRVIAYTSATQVSIQIMDDFSNAKATEDWEESKFSDRRGWPTSVAFHEGRLWWFGKDAIAGSISDAFDSFDPEFEGDAGPILTTIGNGPVDTINWGLSLQRLLLGGQATEFSARSSALDEPLTPTNFQVKVASTQGSKAVQALKLDREGVFVQRNGARVYSLSIGDNGYDYDSTDLTSLWPEAGSPGVVRMTLQRQPDTRIHCVRSDGTVLLGVMDRTENVLAWMDVETDGLIEDVVVLNGTDVEDDVYYLVKRTIDGSTVRYLEKWAKESECRGGTLNKQADSFVTYTGAATTTITAAHLANETVVVWADGADVGTEDDYTQTYTLDGSGQATLTASVTNYVVGLPYTAQWKSTRLPDVVKGGAAGQSLIYKTRIDALALIMAWVHPKGLRYGLDFNTLDDLPQVEDGATIDPDTIRTTYAESSFIFRGTSDVNARLCLQAQAPRPVTILAAIPETS